MSNTHLDDWINRKNRKKFKPLAMQLKFSNEIFYLWKKYQIRKEILISKKKKINFN